MTQPGRLHPSTTATSMMTGEPNSPSQASLRRGSSTGMGGGAGGVKWGGGRLRNNERNSRDIGTESAGITGPPCPLIGSSYA